MRRWLLLVLLFLVAIGAAGQVQREFPALDTDNVWTGSDTFNGPVVFNGSLNFAGSTAFKNINGIRWADQFPGASVTAKIDAAIADFGGNPGLVIVPSSMGTGSPSSPVSNVTLVDLRENTTRHKFSFWDGNNDSSWIYQRTNGGGGLEAPMVYIGQDINTATDHRATFETLTNVTGATTAGKTLSANAFILQLGAGYTNSGGVVNEEPYCRLLAAAGISLGDFACFQASVNDNGATAAVTGILAAVRGTFSGTFAGVSGVGDVYGGYFDRPPATIGTSGYRAGLFADGARIHTDNGATVFGGLSITNSNYSKQHTFSVNGSGVWEVRNNAHNVVILSVDDSGKGTFTGGLEATDNLKLNGASTGSATLSVTATGGTLNLGSVNATVTSGGMGNFTGGLEAKTSLQLDGATSGSATISVTATGGTLNLGSTNATVDATGKAKFNGVSGLTRTCGIVFGDESAAALTTGNIQPQKSQCLADVNMTLKQIVVMVDAGASTVRLAYRTSGGGAPSTTAYTAAALVPATVTNITDKIVCANVGGTTITVEGISVTCSTLATTTWTAGDGIETIGGTADGTSKRMSIFVTAATN